MDNEQLIDYATHKHLIERATEINARRMSDIRVYANGRDIGMRCLRPGCTWEVTSGRLFGDVPLLALQSDAVTHVLIDHEGLTVTSPDQLPAPALH